MNIGILLRLLGIHFIVLTIMYYRPTYDGLHYKHLADMREYSFNLWSVGYETRCNLYVDIGKHKYYSRKIEKLN